MVVNGVYWALVLVLVLGIGIEWVPRPLVFGLLFDLFPLLAENVLDPSSCYEMPAPSFGAFDRAELFFSFLFEAVFFWCSWIELFNWLLIWTWTWES